MAGRDTEGTLEGSRRGKSYGYFVTFSNGSALIFYNKSKTRETFINLFQPFGKRERGE